MIGGDTIKTYSETVIGAFLSCYKDVDIARAAGLSRDTIRKYKRDPDFIAVLNERRAAIVGAAVDKMTASILRDADRLQEIIDNPDVNPAVRVQAIGTKWSHLREWRAMLDFDNRLRALEAANLGEIRQFRPGGGK